MMEFALVFGRMTAGKFQAARRLVLSIPSLCDGKVVECDLAYRSRSRRFAALMRLASSADEAILSRVRFWAAKTGGRAVTLSTMTERRRSNWRQLLVRWDLHRLGIQPELLADALSRVALAIGAAPDKPVPSRPILILADSRQTWDGVVYEPDSRRLFLPSSLSPPKGDEFAVQIWRTDGSRLEVQAEVALVFGPGQRGPGAPAGFALNLLDPTPELVDTVEDLSDSRHGGRRMAPRYALDAPVLVRPRGREGRPVARLEYVTEEELAADYVANLSQGGAFVRSARALPVGTLVHLEIRLPGGAVLGAPATVVRSDAAGMGMRFELDASGEAQLGEIIARISARRRRALVVDDDALARRMIADALAERGFEVFAASDGLSGVGVLTDELLGLDLVVADVRMPAMDGEAFLRLVRGVGGEHDLAVVVISGALDVVLEARLHREGADAVLDKALGPALIAQASDVALERKRLERSQ